MQAYWKRIFSIAKEYRQTYGTLPHAATFDEFWQEKRQAAIDDPDNPFDPKHRYDHLVYCGMEDSQSQWGLRGAKEPTMLCNEDFVRGLMGEGNFAGIPFINLLPNHDEQKLDSLTLKNPTKSTNKTSTIYLPIMYSANPYSSYQTMSSILDSVPECVGPNRIFRKEASKKQIEVS